MTDRTRLPLPNPWAYCYSFETNTSQRLSFSANKYNGMPPTKTISIYTADQMHQYSDASNAALRAELAKHQESEFHPDWSMLSATRDSLAEHQDMIRRLSERVKVLEDALAKIDAIRNDIVGRQSIGWSRHVYPLVAALGDAGYEGMGYEAARAALEATNG